MYSKKVLLLIVLVAVFVVLLTADYELLFFNSKKQQKEYVYLSSGMVDKLFTKDSNKKYSNIITGNIFNLALPNKPKKIVPKPVVNTEFMLEIRGLTITPESRYALIWDKQEQKAIVATEGEEIKKWQVLSIFNDRIVLGSADVKKEILLTPEENEQKNNEN